MYPSDMLTTLLKLGHVCTLLPLTTASLLTQTKALGSSPQMLKPIEVLIGLTPHETGEGDRESGCETMYPCESVAPIVSSTWLATSELNLDIFKDC